MYEVDHCLPVVITLLHADRHAEGFHEHGTHQDSSNFGLEAEERLGLDATGSLAQA